MSLRFNWPLFSLEQVGLAKEQLTIALNSGPKTQNIVGDIKITDLSFGTKAPDLTCVSLEDLQPSFTFPKGRVMLHLVYDGDAHLVLNTLVQVNPLSQNTDSMLPFPKMISANHPLILPLSIKISEIRLKGIILLGFDSDQGLTTKFKSENPLSSLRVSSSFDHVESIKNTLQEQIENQIRSLFKTDLPRIIKRLSQTFVKDRSRDLSPIKSPDSWKWNSQDSEESWKWNSQESQESEAEYKRDSIHMLRKTSKSHNEKWRGNSQDQVFAIQEPVLRCFQSEEGLGNLDVDYNDNLVFREKLKSIVTSPTSVCSSSMTETRTRVGSKSGFRKLKSERRVSSVTGSLPLYLERKKTRSDDDVEIEPEIISRVDVEATGTDIASKLTNYMSGNHAFNTNALVTNSNTEIVHRADPSLTK